MPTTSKPLTKRAKDVLLNLRDRRSAGTFLTADGLPTGKVASGNAIKALLARLETGGLLNGWVLTTARRAVASNQAAIYRKRRGLPPLESTRE